MALQIIPLHPAQQDMYMDQLINPESPHNNTGGYTKLTGRLDKEKFREAVNSVPDVFDSFKLRFDFENPANHAYFDEDYRQYDLPELDMSHESWESIEAWMMKQFSTPFPVMQMKKETPLYFQYLIKVSEQEHLYFIKCHHLLSDGYGLAAKLQYMAAKYKSLAEGEEVQFNYASYKDEAIIASAHYNSDAYAQDGAYWKNKISKKPESLLQRKHRQGIADDKKSDALILEISGEVRSFLEELLVKTNASLQQLTIAAFIIYFAKTSGRSEFYFGVPLHKRRNKQLRRIAGMFTGLIPFKGIYKPGTTLEELIKQISASQREDYRYQNYLLGDLIRHLKVNSTEDYLLEIIVNNATLNFELDFGEGLEGISSGVPNGYLPYPLELIWYDYGKQQPLQLRVDFQLQYFTKNEVSLLTQRVLHILQQFPDALNGAVENIDIIPAEERAVLSAFGTAATMPIPAGASLVNLFAEQAARRPDAIAAVFEGKQLTYRTLDERSSQLAHYLQNMGVKADKLVPVCIERSMDMLICILGIMKAGGAYVPIDPEYPQERIKYILEDTGAYVVVSSSYSRKRIPQDVPVRIVTLDAIPDMIGKESAGPLDTVPSPNDLAYVIYTSGSTGMPKGVMVEHRGMLNHLLAKVNDLQLNEASVIAYTASYTFDISVWQMFAALLCGGTTIVYPDHLIFNPAALIKSVDQQKVTILELVPSYLAAVLRENTGAILNNLDYLLVTGEAVSQPVLAQWFSQTTIPVVNAYGPTEASDDICHYFMYNTPEQTNIPLGTPIQNLRIYILNESLEILPLGVVGEICVSGVGVARGYLNRPEQTAAKFITDPFTKDRMYRTGDLGRWLPDGTIEYLGRIDDQVKIRGYRIELGEIETMLLKSPFVSQAVVVVKAGGLTGYIVPDGTFDKEGILNWLNEKLPGYMIPALLIEVDSLPLTANGKIDKNALPDPDAGPLLVDQYVAPGNEIESQIAAICGDLLKTERIGIYDNLQELGMHSLLMMREATLLQETFGIQISVRTLFQLTSIASLANYITLHQRASMPQPAKKSRRIIL
ncbi:amino acid adenylation domain-containing protein [Chitinophaga oryziterrae]|uniref:Amino acid adenylation domain-containing protein n=1 Tax=Chitinophaga oryziterrae TaxID=1031224 RepID=A0A6N8J919_9BACT|nr:non-ribosomal peptide synthetase [Chitinophaga oryziterrae]MVT41613.1 amino acid adenylation domain-containing protein [Chitinophaga oryziterrae]